MAGRPVRRGEEVREWMDSGEGTPGEIADAYRQLDTVNRGLGGFKATQRALAGLEGLAAGGSILDVAGGSGGFAARLRRWTAGQVSAGGTVVVLDLDPVAIDAAADRPGLHAVRGDGFELPFRDASFDLVHCSCFFHHLSTTHARDLLAEMCRVSRRAVIVNDLVRSWVAWGAIRVLADAFSENPLIRHDGPLSVLKSFAPGELGAIARAVGEAPDYRWRLAKTFPYRMTLTGVRAPA